MQNKTQNWIIQAIASGAIKATVFQATLVALPFVVASMTAVAGSMQSIPWMWVLMATSVAFASVAVGVLRFHEVLGRLRVEGKLFCECPRIALEISNQGICLGVALRSTADVPIEFEVEDMKTELMGVYPPKKAYPRKNFIVPPNGVAWFDDYEVQIGEQVSTTVTGVVEMQIRYGKPARLKHQLHIKKQVVIRFSDKGVIDAFAWNDAS